MSDAPIFHARVDTRDRLIAADDALAAINARAGGAIGDPLAAPQLATIVRLARRLRILVQRGVTIADADLDLDCWVKASPQDDGVSLTIAILRERGAPRGLGDGSTIWTETPPPADARWLWTCDAQLRLTHVGVDAAARHGIELADAIGRPLTWLFALEEAGDGMMPILEAAALHGDFDRQAAIMRRSGERVSLAGSARHRAGGGFGGFRGGVFAPLDDARPAAAALLGAGVHQRLESVLRPPLGRIIAAADTLNAGSDGPIDPHYADYAADIAHAGRHLLGLVDDLADLEAIERADFAVEVEAIDLADVARRAAGLLAVRAADADVRIDRGDLDQPHIVRAEFGRTLQIMVNLLGNAVRYSPRGATVWIRLQREADRITVIVADQGKGIAADDHARIFDKFERVDPGEAGGSGLGLYIARRLARAMAGDLSVDSAPGQGARFVMVLPAA